MSNCSRRVLAAAVIAAAATLVVAVVPSIHFAYEKPGLHIALETTASLVGLLAAFLVYGRLRESLRLDYLLLAAGLTVLALTNLVFAVLPAAVGTESSTLTVWPAMVGRITGALLLTAAAFAPGRPLAARRSLVPAMLSSAAVFAAGLAALAAALGGALPEGVVEVPLADSSRPRLDGHPALLGAQIVTALLFAAAAWGFLRRANERADGFFGWLAVAAVLASFSRLNYFLFPSLYSDWVYVGDVFRLLFYGVLLGAALGEITRYWRAVAAAAAVEERRRLARDLHDGLAQELAFLARTVPVLDDRLPQDEVVGRLRGAVERAQTESRQLINALALGDDDPPEALVTRVAREVAERWGIQLDLKLTPGLSIEGERREALLRVTAEALINAAKHSGADRASVLLEPAGANVRLRVSDAGSGFDPEAARRRDAFGLTSMAGRVAAVGGRVRVDAARGRGATIEVIL